MAARPGTQSNGLDRSTFIGGGDGGFCRGSLGARSLGGCRFRGSSLGGGATVRGTMVAHSGQPLLSASVLGHVSCGLGLGIRGAGTGWGGKKGRRQNKGYSCDEEDPEPKC